MSRTPLAALALSLALAACATPPREDPSAPVSAAVYNGGLILAIVGTPFYALAKATSCVASTVVASGSSAGLALTDRSHRYWEREALQEGVAHNCGGPYWLAPAY